MNVLVPVVKAPPMLNPNEQGLYKRHMEYIKNVYEIAICKCYFSICEQSTKKGPVLESLLFNKYDSALTKVLQFLRDGDVEKDKPPGGMVNKLYHVTTSTASAGMSGGTMLRKYRYIFMC